ncbi:MAG: putative Ig domain-containing protein [Acidimicrobiales bacterium]
MDTPYSYQFDVWGIPTPRLAHSGKLPRGLTLTRNGALSGTPTTPGTFAFTITGKNKLGSSSEDVSLTISP